VNLRALLKPGRFFRGSYFFKDLKLNLLGFLVINWGLVSGKTNTIYAWDTRMPDGRQPSEWFHDIFRGDGSAYKPDEVKLIKQLTVVEK
jgi:hypothetical protein